MPVRYITVTPVTNLFKPATRAFGDVAIVGRTDNDATGPFKTPVPVTNPDSVSHKSNPGGKDKRVEDVAWFKGALGRSVRKALVQNPGPTTVYAVRIDPADAGNALALALAEVAKLDAQIVVLAETALGPPAVNRAEIEALAAHVNGVSNTGGDGKERIGIAMLGKDVTDTTVLTANMSINRMVMVAHKSDEDAAAAVAGVIGGQEPHISLLLKQVQVGMDNLFSDAEIDAFNTARVNWLTDPTLLPGRGLFLGEGYTLGVDQPYIDVVRVIDDISFRLKAALIRSIGDLRISRSGLRNLTAQMSAVLEPLRLRQVIDQFDVFLPLLVLLDKAPESLTDAELQQIHDARVARTVDAIVSVNYAGAIHRLNITLKFE